VYSLLVTVGNSEQNSPTPTHTYPPAVEFFYLLAGVFSVGCLLVCLCYMNIYGVSPITTLVTVASNIRGARYNHFNLLHRCDWRYCLAACSAGLLLCVT